ncbi:MAG: flagellar export protein FliJ [Phycisphaeraceae bacterium]|nr:flagellar export protein FliJ [Phycisphaeraceae bacterium]
MSRFVFELESVLALRQRQEKDRQRAVAAIQRERVVIEEKISGYQRQIALAKQAMRAQLSSASPAGGVAVSSVRMEAVAVSHMMVLAQRAVLDLAAVHARLEAARTELVRAATARKAVETLRSRRFERWRLEQSRKETAAMDEIGSLLTDRRRREAEGTT